VTEQQQGKTTFHVALIGGPLNAHRHDAHVERTIDVNSDEPPRVITATPAGLFFDLAVPKDVGRYGKVDEDSRIAGIVGELPDHPDAFYEWQTGNPIANPPA
jgi:hypothetical protein